MPFVKRTNTKNPKPSADTRKIFIGRTNELDFFVEQILTPEDPSYNIISISGEGGVGKTTLVERFIDEAHSLHFRDYCLVGYIDEQQVTPYSVMEKFAQQLSEVGTPLFEFEKALTRYKEAVRKLNIDQETAQENAVRETVEIVGSVVDEVPVVGGILNKGASVLTDLSLKEYHIRQMLKDAALLENPISDLTRIFIDELNQTTDKQVINSTNRTKRQQRIILFFDTFERLADEIAPWILEHFLQANISTNIVIVIAGRDSVEHSTPNDPKPWLRYRDQNILFLINLNPFSEDETRDYLAKRGITDLKRITTIWQSSKGLPFYLSLLTFNLDMNVDPTADVVANILKWIPDHEPVKRQLALNAALLSRPFNQDGLTAFPFLSQDKATILFRWLIKMPFIRNNPLDGRYRYYELAQDMFRRHLFQFSRQEYYATRRDLVAYYQRLLDTKQKEKMGNDALTESIEVTLALAYQLFYLPDEASHIVCIEYVLNIYKQANTEQKNEIIRFLRDLPLERHNNKMSTDELLLAKHLLQFLEALTEGRHQKVVEAANGLIKKATQGPNFSTKLLGWILNSTGLAYRNLKEYRRAIETYNRAIELDPISAYYRNRGTNYHDLKEHQRAIQDFDRAIELNPTSSAAYNNRGIAYDNLRGYQHAIENYNRAIELNPTSALYYFNRGCTYGELKEFQLAIQDFDRAIELNPTSAPAPFYRNRGIAYRDLKEYQRAIQDFDRAIELNPSYVRAYRERSESHRLLGNFENALLDLDHVLTLKVAIEGEIYNTRGLILSYLSRYDEAIEEYEKGLREKPDNIYLLYYMAVVMVRGRSIIAAQPHIRTAREALLSINNDEELAPKFYGLGGIAASVGDIDQALDYLQKAVFLGERVVGWARHDIAWIDLRGNPRFQAITAEQSIKLP